ncbi:MAG TPA: hypothetical protein VGG39_30735 [Polyangiaceae bacterium]|jgi:hypothetical protein
MERIEPARDANVGSQGRYVDEDADEDCAIAPLSKRDVVEAFARVSRFAAASARMADRMARAKSA